MIIFTSREDQITYLVEFLNKRIDDLDKQIVLYPSQRSQRRRLAVEKRWAFLQVRELIADAVIRPDGVIYDNDPQMVTVVGYFEMPKEDAVDGPVEPVASEGDDGDERA